MDAKPVPVAAFRAAALASDGCPKDAATGVHLTDEAHADRAFWRSLGVSKTSAQYGADQDGTVFGDDASAGGGWNLNRLDSILSHGLPPGLGGITSPMLYFGQWRALFSWHCEDMDLNSVNYLHFGAPKIWYAVAPKDAARLKALAATHFGEEANVCKQFMRHKNVLISPKQLARAGIPFVRAVQREREFMITFPKSYHMGFNCGWNCAESVNFATPRWIPFGRASGWCTCEAYTLRADMDDFCRRVRRAVPERLPVDPRDGDLIVVRWEGSGEYVVRVRARRNKSGIVSASAPLTVVPPFPEQRSAFGSWPFSPSEDEWRWPSERDCCPWPGDLVAVKWEGYAEEYFCRVLDPMQQQQQRPKKRKRKAAAAAAAAAATPRAAVVPGLLSVQLVTTGQVYDFNPKVDDWHWPEKSAAAEVEADMAAKAQRDKEYEAARQSGAKAAKKVRTLERRAKKTKQTRKRKKKMGPPRPSWEFESAQLEAAAKAVADAAAMLRGGDGGGAPAPDSGQMIFKFSFN